MSLTEKPTSPTIDAPRAPANGREHLVTVLFGLWMTVGLFLDGYFHQNLDGDSESFFTPWHAVFYAGFTASALWIGSMSWRRDGGTFDWRLRFLPPGYEAARTGLVLFGLGGIGDAAWHTAFGVERGIDALLSPTHLLLLVGLVLVLTAPIRAAAAEPTAPPTPWMVAGSVICATALVGFFLNFAWGLGIAALGRTPYDPISETGETQVIAGVASTFVTTAILFGAVRLLRRPPTGAVVALFLVVAGLVSGAFDEDIEGVGAALVAGIVLEALARAGVDRARAFAVASAILWLSYFGMLAAGGISWPAEIWMGATVLNAMAAYTIGATSTAEITS